MINFCIRNLSGRILELASKVERRPGWLDVVRR
jgi:hypothetical protein